MKQQEILRYSNPKQVRENLRKLFPNDKHLKLKISTRQDKKYMAKGDFSLDEWVHFGSYNPPMQDYTLHNDDKRRTRFRQRNKKWATMPKDTPAYLSYWILW